MKTLLTAAATLAALTAIASADPPKAALGVLPGGQEATLRAAWSKWIKAAAWAELRGPAAPTVVACLATDPACGEALAGLGADRTWILALDPPASPGGEPFVSGRIYDRAGVLVTSSQRACPKCARDKAALTAAVGELLDGLQAAAAALTTRLVIEVDAPGAQVLVDDSPIQPSADGQPVAPGAHRVTIVGECWEMAPQSVIVNSGETARARLAVTPRAPHLRIRTHPGGMRVEVDGAPAGVSAADGTLDVAAAAGVHRVRASGDGWPAVTQEVTLAGCEQRAVELVLRKRAAKSKLPYLIGGGGVALVGTGLALVIVDRRMVSDDRRNATYRDSAPLGAVLSGAGLAAVGVAYYLWRREPPLLPAVVATDGGAAAMVSGSF